MKTGVYRIFLKAKPASFYIVGIANFEAYWKEHGDKSLGYSLVWECLKQDLPKYTAHFIEKFKPTWDGKIAKEKSVIPEPEAETTQVEEPEVKSSALTMEKNKIKKPARRKK